MAMPVTIRPIRPEDEPLLIQLHQALSERTVYLRYFQPLKLSQRTAHERLTRICFIDYDREMALVVEHKKRGRHSRRSSRIGRLSKLRARATKRNWPCWSTIVSSIQGLGTELYRRLIAVARDEKAEARGLDHPHREPRDARDLPEAGLPDGERSGRRNRAGTIGGLRGTVGPGLRK